ncbi:MAG: hypothetical protein COV67_05370 [Nitrospinae bacterium CG11_big_fil_rev_8_21_14_0_20_56_8]|nr:MAG: hypothetical protein COV67_05370 [Nitrospinae bacterium CG11_big_fil_rev_8_21_14_0_20_56_8]
MPDQEKLENEEDLEQEDEESSASAGPDEDPDSGEYDVDFIDEDEWGEEKEEEEELPKETVPLFVDNGDGTISDPRNKLMWKKDDSYHQYGYGITWYEAHDYCELLNEKKFAGYDDWRLCGYDEAKTLFSFTNANFDKDGAELHIDSLFEPKGGHNTWTYDEKPDYAQYAMKFSYVTGNEVWENKDNEYSHCRVVRDDQKEEWEPEWRRESRKYGR